MIDPGIAILLFTSGSGITLLGVLAGVIVHMRWLDRKLLPPPAKPTVKLPVAGGTQA